MLKNVTQLEVIIDNKIARFTCDMDTPVNVVKEMLFQFQKYVGQIEDQARASQEEAKNQEEEKASEEKPSEEKVAEEIINEEAKVS